MKKHIVLLVAVGAFLGTVTWMASADEPPGPLEGTWSVVAVTMNGVKATDLIADGFTLTVRGDKLLLKPGLSVDGNGKVEPGSKEGDEVIFTLDPKKSPAHIDLTFRPRKDKIALKGIYVIEKGELKICFSYAARPADFANVAESGQTLLIAKPKKP